MVFFVSTALLCSIVQAQAKSKSGQSNPCIVRVGYGADFARIGVTQRTEIKSLPSGVTLNYDDSGRVSELVIDRASSCQTDKGIKVGDSLAWVTKLYGSGKRSRLQLTKGSTVIGYIGDFTLSYPGIAFYFSKHAVFLIEFRSGHN